VRPVNNISMDIPESSFSVKQPKRKLKPGMGKSKGNGFESTIAKLLTKHLSPLNFIRTQGSGARVGGKNFATIGQLFGEDALKLFVGDVVPTNERDTSLIFRHCIECKSYKTADSLPLLIGGSSNVYKWMQEAADDAIKVNKNPLLIFKWNHSPVLIATYSLPTKIVTLDHNGRHIEIGLLDETFAHLDFWYA